jgi:hypothetical protein
MIEVMKEVVKNYLSNQRPTRMVFGTIESIAPLSVRINEKLLLPKELVIWPPEFVQEDVGKKVLMLQQEGGQHYYILEVRA